MMKFFRKIRQNLLSEGKTGKYFKYAIGEIFLVVIGILIALQINNCNEIKKSKSYEHQVYKQIYNDIISDSLNLANYINDYEQRDTLLNRILYDSVPSIAYDTITKENQLRVPYSITLITSFNKIVNTKKGYQLFSRFNITETDSLSYFIEGYYLRAIDNENSKEVENVSIKNLEEFQQKDWFLDFALKRRLNPSYLNYIKTSDDFKTRAFNYQIFAIRNYCRSLKQQQELGEALKERIKSRLEK